MIKIITHHPKKVLDKLNPMCYNKTIQERKKTTMDNIKVKILRDGKGNAIRVVKINVKK